MESIAEIKSALFQQLANTDDEKILRKVQSYLHSAIKKEKKIIAYSSKWKPLTIDEYKKEIGEALLECKRGEIVTQKEIESAH